MEDRQDIIKIKVVGIGGGGNNVVNRMIEDGVKNVEFININTELNNLVRSKTSNTLQIGKDITNNLGTGSNVEIGEMAAIRSEDKIREKLKGADMIFLTAGMGGGTGTGAISVIARICKELEILTIAVVTKPFTFEGKKKKDTANLGTQKLYENVDALIVILNNNLINIATTKTSLIDSFNTVDLVVKQSIQSITDIITIVGDINIDFADIKTVMQNKGAAYMGVGSAKGENKVAKATRIAISNPLTEKKLNGAKGVIFNVRGGKNVELIDINSGINLVNEVVDEDANVIFGTTTDESLGDEVVVTVIGTGIESEYEKAANAGFGYGYNEFNNFETSSIANNSSSINGDANNSINTNNVYDFMHFGTNAKEKNDEKYSALRY